MRLFGTCVQCCPLAFPAIIATLLAVFVTTWVQSKFAMAPLTSRSTRLASTLIDKIKADEFWVTGNKRHWYALDPANLGELSKTQGAEMRRVIDYFVEMFEDESTKKFIEDSVDLSDSVLTQLWHNLAKSFLSLFYTQTDINGYLGRGSMFVFSEEQFRFLLDKAGIGGTGSGTDMKLGNTLMDLGAGDGAPTERISSFFGETHVTETSWAMRNILDKKGFKVLEVETWSAEKAEFYDMISCLNLFDRCDKPVSLLAEIKGALKPGGLLLVALVLPFRPYVEYSENKTHKPVEELPFFGATFESQVLSVVSFFDKEDFQLKSWTRVPYLCQGDLAQSVYVLDDALFLFSKK